MPTSYKLKQFLQRQPVWFLTLYASLTSFGVYFCMYAFRKPFTAAGYTSISFLNIDYKVWLVTAQVIGYMLSKFYGIRFISSLQPEKRAATIVKLILFAWLALLLFAVTKAPWNIVFLFLNGFPLGMVWGLVFSFIEGRKTTELMGAVLSVSFIFSSGIVKSIGKSLIVNAHISEMWMPFITGAFFAVPLFLFTWLLQHIPPPSIDDVQQRSPRQPMNNEERKAFVKLFLPGLVLIVFTYVLLTVLRDFRDNFSNELYTEMGYQNNPAIFTLTEVPVSLLVLACMGLLIWVQNNLKAFLINHYIVMLGYALCLLATFLFVAHFLNAIIWMTLVGTGLYMSYVPFNALYFERMIATYKVKSNVGFIMYIADAFGYLGSVIVLFVKEFVGMQLSWTEFFIRAVIIIAIIGLVGTFIAMLYFKKKFYSIQLKED